MDQLDQPEKMAHQVPQAVTEAQDVMELQERREMPAHQA